MGWCRKREPILYSYLWPTGIQHTSCHRLFLIGLSLWKCSLDQWRDGSHIGNCVASCKIWLRLDYWRLVDQFIFGYLKLTIHYSHEISWNQIVLTCKNWFFLQRVGVVHSSMQVFNSRLTAAPLSFRLQSSAKTNWETMTSSVTQREKTQLVHIKSPAFWTTFRSYFSFACPFPFSQDTCSAIRYTIYLISTPAFFKHLLFVVKRFDILLPPTLVIILGMNTTAHWLRS